MKRPIRNEDRSRASWLVPIGLLLLGIVPGMGVALRLADEVLARRR